MVGNVSTDDSTDAKLAASGMESKDLLALHRSRKAHRRQFLAALKATLKAKFGEDLIVRFDSSQVVESPPGIRINAKHVDATPGDITKVMKKYRMTHRRSYSEGFIVWE